MPVSVCAEWFEHPCMVAGAILLKRNLVCISSHKTLARFEILLPPEMQDEGVLPRMMANRASEEGAHFFPLGIAQVSP